MSRALISSIAAAQTISTSSTKSSTLPETSTMDVVTTTASVCTLLLLSGTQSAAVIQASANINSGGHVMTDLPHLLTGAHSVDGAGSTSSNTREQLPSAPLKSIMTTIKQVVLYEHL